MPTLLDPIAIGPLKLKNRIVMPAMGTQKASIKGEVTKELIKHYVERAEGPGLIIVEFSYVDVSGKTGLRQLGIYDDKLIPGLSELTEAVHKKGTPIAIQIDHSGSATTSEICGAQPVAPSPIKHAGPRWQEIPRALTKDEITCLAEEHAQAAQRAVKAGFDGVEVHGAHWWLLSQFASPLTNKRTDEYGGSLENRMRFALQIVSKVKARIGSDFPLFYRLGATDMIPGGLTLEESKKIAQALVKAGVHVINVSGGLCGIEPPGPGPHEPGFFVPYAEEIKRIVNVPVIGVGGIKTPSLADEIIRKGRADLVAIGRALLTDPEWASKAIRMLQTT